ncbi:hypothetical protein A5655_04855 [Mycobacterium sp. 1081908.1]|nr:hypothetical protein A5655_04855 [Mycobacterium sp. 1081908.1]
MAIDAVGSKRGLVLVGITTFKTVAAGDGSPQSPSAYAYYLLLHAIATALLLIALVTAIWQFMDWVAAPSCPRNAALASVSSPVAASHRAAAPGDADCPCPHERQRENV